jgi:PAS domain S-box-containing protein
MKQPALKILVVEDDLQFKELIFDIIVQTGESYTRLEHAGSLQQAHALLEQDRFDVVLLDLNLPDSSGLETVSRMRYRHPQIPILVLTGQKDKKYAQQALEAGAQEFLLKEEALPSLLGRAIRYAVERKLSEDRLRESEQRQKAILDSVQVGILVIDPQEYIIMDINPAALAMVGKRREQVIGQVCHRLVCPADEGACPLTDKKQKADHSERELIGPDGNVPILKTVCPIVLNGKEHLLESFLDITEIKQAKNVLEKSRERLEREVAKRTEELQIAKTQWESTFDAVPDLIILVDRDHKIIRCNRAFAERIGLKPQDTIGKKCYKLIHGTDYPPDFCPHEKLLKDETDHMEEVYEKTLDAYLQITTSPLKDSQGRVYASVHVARDISELKNAQKKISDQLEFMQKLVDTIPNPVFVKNREGVYILVNSSFEERFGSKQSVLGGTVYEVALEDLAKEHTEQEEKIWETGDTLVYESQINDINGNLRDVIVNKALLYNSNGEPFGIVGISIDITERKRMERQLIKAQRLDAIGQLAAGIAHEINTPTQFIHNNIEFLEESCQTLLDLCQTLPELYAKVKSGQAAQEIVQTIQEMMGKADLDYLPHEIHDALKGSLEGVDRITAIVDSMRYFSHPGTEEKAPIDINQALDHAITVSRNEWKYYARITTDLEEDLPVLQGYAVPLNQALLNLIVNAAQAISQKLGETPEEKGVINITTRRVNGDIEIRFSDNGTGIDPEVLPRIFDPFFTTKEVGKGTGQGLALVNTVVVEKHGGHIDVETELGKGTSFIISIPSDE